MITSNLFRANAMDPELKTFHICRYRKFDIFYMISKHFLLSTQSFSTF